MTTEIKIREAGPDDAPGIATVHVETWRDAYAGIAPDDAIANLSLRKRELMWAGHFANRDYRKCIKVADVAGEVIGFVTAGPNRGDEDDILGEVYAIYVLPEYQGRGVGRDLLASATVHLHSREYLPFVLWALEGNDAGRGFYEARQGKLVDRGTHNFGDETRATVAYRWDDISSFYPEDTKQHNIEVIDYDPSWPTRFDFERSLLMEAVAPWLNGAIEHVGSTAVPGLCAKPVIDIMVPVTDLASSYPAICAVEKLGYTYWPYKIDQMHWFCKPGEYIRTHHVHMIPKDSQLFRDRLAFRDALRASASLRQQYAELKQGLAAKHPHDREAYTEAKGPFVKRVLDEASP